MLYEEFLRGTNATASDENYAAYKAIEAVYNMHPTMTKEEAYAIAAPMVKNKLSDELRRVIFRIDAMIEAAQQEQDRAHADEQAARDEGLTSLAADYMAERNRHRGYWHGLRDLRNAITLGEF